MGKDVDLMQAVRNQDYVAVQKLLAKHRGSKSSKFINRAYNNYC